MSVESFDQLLNEVLASDDARTALKENALRRRIAVEFDRARRDQNLSIRALAKRMQTSISQVQRLLHQDLGGSLTLKTVCRGADVLGLRLNVHVRPVGGVSLGKIVQFGTNASWHQDPVVYTAAPTQKVVPKIAVGAECLSEWAADDVDDNDAEEGVLSL